MYEKNKAVRLTLRLTQPQFDFVKENSDLLGVSPSEFLRMVVNMTMASSKGVKANPKAGSVCSEVVYDSIKEMEGLGRENDKADCNDIV